MTDLSARTNIKVETTKHKNNYHTEKTESSMSIPKTPLSSLVGDVCSFDSLDITVKMVVDCHITVNTSHMAAFT